MYEAQFLARVRVLTRNAAFLRGQAWPRPSSPVQRPPWAQRATSPIRGCLRPFLEFSKNERFCQSKKSKKAAQGHQKHHLGGAQGAGPGAAPTTITQVTQVSPSCLGSASPLWKGYAPSSISFRWLKRVSSFQEGLLSPGHLEADKTSRNPGT